MTSSSSSSDDVVEEEEECFLKRVRCKCFRWIYERRSQLSAVVRCAMLAAYVVYYVEAMIYSAEGATALTVFTVVGFLVIVHRALKRYLHERYVEEIAHKLVSTFSRRCSGNRRLLKWTVLDSMLIGGVIYFTLVVFNFNPFRQLRAVLGASILLLTSYITSKASDAVQWSAVVKLLAVQAVIMTLLTRTTAGYEVFEFIASELLKLTLYCISGARGVYGLLIDHSLFFIVTAVQTFLAVLIALIYTLLKSIGVGRKLKHGLRSASDAEIHFLVALLHSFVTALAVSPLCFIAGVSQKHLITAMFTCPPAALAMALVNFPNNETTPPTPSSQTQNVPSCSITTRDHVVSGGSTCSHGTRIKPRLFNNVCLRVARAATNGYLNALVSLASVMAFLSLYQFADATLTWLGSRVGIDITINSVLGYLFTPVAYLVGIDWHDCYLFGCLQAEKVFGFTTRALTLVPKLQSAETISMYTASIATISLCGFGTWTTFCQMTATFFVVAPRRLHHYLNIWLRLAWSTHSACLYSASIAAIIGPVSFFGPEENS